MTTTTPTSGVSTQGPNPIIQSDGSVSGKLTDCQKVAMKIRIFMNTGAGAELRTAIEAFNKDGVSEEAVRAWIFYGGHDSLSGHASTLLHQYFPNEGWTPGGDDPLSYQKPYARAHSAMRRLWNTLTSNQDYRNQVVGAIRDMQAGKDGFKTLETFVQEIYPNRRMQSNPQPWQPQEQAFLTERLHQPGHIKISDVVKAYQNWAEKWAKENPSCPLSSHTSGAIESECRRLLRRDKKGSSETRSQEEGQQPSDTTPPPALLASSSMGSSYATPPSSEGGAFALPIDRVPLEEPSRENREDSEIVWAAQRLVAISQTQPQQEEGSNIGAMPSKRRHDEEWGDVPRIKRPPR